MGLNPHGPSLQIFFVAFTALAIVHLRKETNEVADVRIRKNLRLLRRSDRYYDKPGSN